jgi:hypothetical protein
MDPGLQDRVMSAEKGAKTELEVTEDDLAGGQNVLRTAIQLAGDSHVAYVRHGMPSDVVSTKPYSKPST